MSDHVETSSPGPESNPKSAGPGRPRRPRVLLTGSTGFVGRHLYPVLVDRGCEVFCATRHPEEAARKFGDRNWVEFDIDDESSVASSLRDVDRAYFLVHHLASGHGYEQRERRAAELFGKWAAQCGLERVVYLGGVEPQGEVSRHLAGRLETGRILRSFDVPAIELRAAMIIGAGSASWNIVADLAARLPAMLLPKWLRYSSCPIAIDDVVMALVFAMTQTHVAAGWYNIPGPETVSHAELIRRAAKVLRRKPVMLPVPVLSPTLSSYWIGAVTRTPFRVSREIVQGLQSNLADRKRDFFTCMPKHHPLGIEEAMRLALVDEADNYPSAAAKQRLTQTAKNLIAHPA